MNKFCNKFCVSCLAPAGEVCAWCSAPEVAVHEHVSGEWLCRPCATLTAEITADVDQSIDMYAVVSCVTSTPARKACGG